MKEKKTFGTRELVTAAVLLAICLVAQLFKNTSVFITGPVINACLILCILLCGWVPSIILCVLTPITSAFITGAPIMQAQFSIVQLVTALIGSVYAFIIWTAWKKDGKN